MHQALNIPELITVHGGPPDSSDLNHTIPYADYIKAVISQSVSPLWNESAIRAALYAAQTFVLYRISNGFYRSRGYDFDITGDEAYDLPFTPSGCVFKNINRIADEANDIYIAAAGSLTPLIVTATFNDGKWEYTADKLYCASTEKGLLTDESANRLADSGLSAIEILRAAFGDVTLACGNTDFCSRTEFSARTLSLGVRGRAVSDLQRRLNLISTSFPNIPKINPADGIYGPSTEAAVREFQRTFELPDSGTADCATQRRVYIVYKTVRNMLHLLNLKNMAIPVCDKKQELILSEGNKGDEIADLQNLLNLAALYIHTVKPVPANGLYGRDTTESVLDFQRTFALPPTGDIDRDTYRLLYSFYKSVLYSFENRKGLIFSPDKKKYGGRVMRLGSRGADVADLQYFINCASELYSDYISPVRITGVFETKTRSAVSALQHLHSMPQTGEVGEDEWDMISALQNDIAASRFIIPGQFPGYLLEGEKSREVKF